MRTGSTRWEIAASHLSELIRLGNLSLRPNDPERAHTFFLRWSCRLAQQVSYFFLRVCKTLRGGIKEKRDVTLLAPGKKFQLQTTLHLPVVWQTC